MTYRSKPQFRSWNVAALSLKQEEVEEPTSKDRQRPRRESWSQPPQRGRGMRGRGVWYIDNRPQYRRRYTMPNPGDNCQDFSCHSNDGSSDYNQPEDNPIMEEPRNLSSSLENDSNDFKIKENEEEKYDHREEIPSWNRKFSADNIYRPPKSRSWRSNSSSDDGSQSRSYSDSSSNKYEPENYKAQRKNSWERETINNGSDHVWAHDKYSGSESEQKDKKDASTQVSPLDINNELKNANTANTEKEIITNKLESPKDHKPELSNEITDKPESPKDKIGFPKEITIKFSELTKESDEKPESVVQDSKSELLIEPKVVSETKSEEVIPEVVPSTSPNGEKLTTPALINFDEGDNTRSEEAAPAEVAPEVASEVASGVTPEVAPDKSSEVTPASSEEVELTIPILINLDEDDNTGAQPIQPKISEDILDLDWGSYQKTLIEEEIRRTMEQPTKVSTPRKLDKGLKDFDSLL